MDKCAQQIHTPEGRKQTCVVLWHHHLPLFILSFLSFLYQHPSLLISSQSPLNANDNNNSLLKMDRNHLGRRVWSLPHVRSAVLHKLPDSQLVELLTLNIESFPEVVEALYYELDKTKWMKYLLDAARRLEYPDLVSVTCQSLVRWG